MIVITTPAGQIGHQVLETLLDSSEALRVIVRDPSEVADEDVAEGIVEEAWLAARRGEVRRALGSLPAEQQSVVEMAYFGGYTQAQIAEELGIPLGTVKTRTLAAMRKLRKALQERET